MIAVHIVGGLGNQLFEYAFGRCLALKNNTELKLDLTSFNASQHHNNIYKLGNYNIEENIATPEDLSHFESLQLVRESTADNERRFMPEALNAPDNSFLVGFWQSEKYFNEIADTIRNDFNLKNPLGKNSASWKKKILAADCPVSLHVRHGDYLTPLNRSFFIGVIPVDYYSVCVEKLKKLFPKMTLFVFSDDLDWAKKNLKFKVPTNFVEGCEKDFEEIYLMSICKHNIITHSSFSWWGAWLNKNPDKKVLAPNPWARQKIFGNVDIVPESWIKIPVDYDKKAHVEFPPTLSIIIHVANDNSAVPITMPSIFSQNLNDYEVIIVDSSTDGSGNFCRQFAQKNNVTIKKMNPSAKKYEAWNKGLEWARGEYVLFLTGKDFLASHATFLIAQAWQNNFDRNYKREDEFSYSHYGSSNALNIVCSTQIIEEDAGGSIDVAGRKFSIKTDDPFKNLNGFTEIKIDDAQKLMLLGSQQINNSLGTKFFKRSFLNEHKIRFDEILNGGGRRRS